MNFLECAVFQSTLAILELREFCSYGFHVYFFSVCTFQEMSVSIFHEPLSSTHIGQVIFPNIEREKQRDWRKEREGKVFVSSSLSPSLLLFASSTHNGVLQILCISLSADTTKCPHPPSDSLSIQTTFSSHHKIHLQHKTTLYTKQKPTLRIYSK